MINQIKEKADRIGGGGSGGVNMDLQMAIHEVKDHVRQVREDTASMLKAPQVNIDTQNKLSLIYLSLTLLDREREGTEKKNEYDLLNMKRCKKNVALLVHSFALNFVLY